MPTIVYANRSGSSLYLDNCTGTHSGELGFIKTIDKKVCLHPYDMQSVLSWGHGSVLSVWDFSPGYDCHLKKMNTLNFRDKVLTACWDPLNDGQILTVLEGNRVRIVDLYGPQDTSYQKGYLTIDQVVFILFLYAQAWRTVVNTFEALAARANVCENRVLCPEKERITAEDLGDIYFSFDPVIQVCLKKRYRLSI